MFFLMFLKQGAFGAKLARTSQQDLMFGRPIEGKLPIRETPQRVGSQSRQSSR